jgi:uncharacterized protein involved in tolerance to divalent cations
MRCADVMVLFWKTTCKVRKTLCKENHCTQILQVLNSSYAYHANLKEIMCILKSAHEKVTEIAYSVNSTEVLLQLKATHKLTFENYKLEHQMQI